MFLLSLAILLVVIYYGSSGKLIESKLQILHPFGVVGGAD